MMLATAYSQKENIDNTIVKINKATTGSAYIINNTYYDTLLDLFLESNNNMSHDKWSELQWEKYALDQQWLPYQSRDMWLGFSNDLIRQRNIRSTTNERY
jgi:hypothetical protein